jgi:hypothetical protein
VAWWAQAWVLGLVFGCSAVFPELSTPVRSVPAGQRFEPAPPEDLLFIKFTGAEIPKLTRDGRKWDAIGGDAPDPFAKLIVDGRPILVTPVQSNTLTPTWRDQDLANYRIKPRSEVRVELWDSNPINDHPICAKKIPDFVEEASRSGTQIMCDSGARLFLQVEPARAQLGLGFWYELQSESIVVTRRLTESPATRAGLEPGDEIVKIQGKEVKGFEEGQAKSLINANSRTGLLLVVRKKSGKLETLKLKEGPIYPTAAESHFE